MLDPALYNHIYLTSDVDQTSLDHIRAAVNSMDRPITVPFGGSTDEVQEVKLAPKPILLHIDSPGGYVKSCISIIRIILNAKTPVHTVVEGMAASSAALILACGQKRFAYPDSIVLIHQHRKTLHPHAPETITHEDDLVEAEQGTALYELMKGFLSERTKMTPTLLQSLLSRDKFLSASEAKRLGLVTQILNVPALHPTPTKLITPRSIEADNHIVIGHNTLESSSIVHKIHNINLLRNTSTHWRGHIIGGHTTAHSPADRFGEAELLLRTSYSQRDPVLARPHHQLHGGPVSRVGCDRESGLPREISLLQEYRPAGFPVHQDERIQSCRHCDKHQDLAGLRQAHLRHTHQVAQE